uniref:Uncharacterized protein n=1 Tax=Arundo donax TaxID=35708 RepID=A0A0A9ERY5_ARUDO
MNDHDEKIWDPKSKRIRNRNRTPLPQYPLTDLTSHLIFCSNTLCISTRQSPKLSVTYIP